MKSLGFSFSSGKWRCGWNRGLILKGPCKDICCMNKRISSSFIFCDFYKSRVGCFPWKKWNGGLDIINKKQLIIFGFRFILWTVGEEKQLGWECIATVFSRDNTLSDSVPKALRSGHTDINYLNGLISGKIYIPVHGLLERLVI